jgi:hypothetical protein
VIGWNQIHEFIEASRWEAKAARGIFPVRQPTFSLLGVVGEEMARSATNLPVFDSNQEPHRQQRDADDFALWRVRDLSVGGLGLSSDHAPMRTWRSARCCWSASPAKTRWSLGRIMRKFKGLKATMSTLASS